MRLHDEQPGQVRRPRGLRPRHRRAGAAHSRRRTPRTSRYLRTKRERMGHLLDGLDDVALTRPACRTGRSTALGGRVGARAARATARASGLRVAVACARFNGGITLAAARRGPAALADCGVGRDDVTVAWVPGAVRAAAGRPGASPTGGTVDAVDRPRRRHPGRHRPLRLRGRRVRGRPAAGASSTPVVPVVFGVLTTDTVDQALERSRPDETEQGLRGRRDRARDGPSAGRLPCRPASA